MKILHKSMLPLLLLAAIGSTQASEFRYRYSLSQSVPYQWGDAGVVYDAWKDKNDYYNCKNWSPSPSTVGKSIAFTQTATDCSQDQVRTAHPQQKDARTGKIENIPGAEYQETQTIATTHTRDAIGILESWMTFTPTYTNWSDTNALYGCTSWSPDPAIYTVSTNFTQNSSTCKTDQERLRQDREQEKYTEEVRNNGEPVTENQTLTAQHASRGYTVGISAWANNGAVTSCSNWSPDPATVTIGQSFTQNATDCLQPQTRVRAESYVDHKTGSTVQASSVNQSQSITASSSRTATGTKETWVAATPTYTAWTNTNALYGCAAWTPTGSSKTVTGTFTQTAADCETDQTRNRQDREQESTTLAYRNKGTPVAETQTLTSQTATRSYTVTLGSWTNSGAKYGCTNWSPAPSTVTIGQSFTQTATDCEQDQTRTRAESYVDHKTGSTVAVTVPAETQTLTGQSSTQTATGTKETWVAATPTYTAWVNSNALYGCVAWTPASSTKTITGTFTQTAADCETDQTRNRQDREQESTTLAYRNKGTPVVENQTLTSQTATRSYTVTLGSWANSGAKYGCTNWSPAPATVTIGQSFTQTASDCEQDQTRTRAESYVDHKTGSTIAVTVPAETQTLTGQSSTQTATGTKETWISATPTYTAWTNTNALYGCVAWTPLGSSKTVTGTFTQTAADCETDQTRNRQDREQESTTLAYRNKGTPVVENQTLTSQTATRSYTVTLGSWTNSGAKYACTNWSPAPATVTIGQNFTQTATDCKQDQTRTRAESYVDHKSGSTVAVTVPAETQTLTGQTSTQTATGTKETWVATTSVYSAWGNTSGVYSCTNWSPAPSTVTIGQSFTQTATDCSVNQSRTRQDRQVETTTGAIRNNGAVVTETQTIGGQTGSQTATGTKQTWVATTSVYSAWGNTSGVYSCTNWSPAPSAVTINQAFTQTATNCYINQSRTRQDRLVETTTGAIANNGAVVTETQTIGGQTGYQTAYGTKQTWAYYPPVYGGWYNTSGYYSCGTWSPNASSIDQGVSFTQSASCYINQARSRQDRLYETTTGQVINNGGAVTETQTIATTGYQTAVGTYRDHIGGH
jgi:hypothetical protein